MLGARCGHPLFSDSYSLADSGQGLRPKLSDDVPHFIARNSESTLSTDGSAFRAYFGTTEAEVNNNVEIAIAPTQSDSYWLRP